MNSACLGKRQNAHPSLTLGQILSKPFLKHKYTISHWSLKKESRQLGNRIFQTHKTDEYSHSILYKGSWFDNINRLSKLKRIEIHDNPKCTTSIWVLLKKRETILISVHYRKIGTQKNHKSLWYLRKSVLWMWIFHGQN